VLPKNIIQKIKLINLKRDRGGGKNSMEKMVHFRTYKLSLIPNR
jgi:hypothetical protein